MSFYFNWNSLDNTVSSAVRSILNAKLKEIIDKKNNNHPNANNSNTNTSLEEELMSNNNLADFSSNNNNNNQNQNINNNIKNKSNVSFFLEFLAITDLEWGNVSPYVEIVNFEAAKDIKKENNNQNKKYFNNTTLNNNNNSSNSQTGMVETSSETFNSNTSNNNNNNNENNNINLNNNHINFDSLAPYIGESGLLIRLHVTYGGSLKLALSTAVRVDLKFSFPTQNNNNNNNVTIIPLRMPITALLTEVDFDFFISFNIHKNECQIFLEQGKILSNNNNQNNNNNNNNNNNIFNRFGLKVIFGEKKGMETPFRHTKEENNNNNIFSEHESSSNLHYYSRTDDVLSHTSESNTTMNVWNNNNNKMESFYSAYNFSNEESQNGVFIEESEISNFIEKELKSVLEEKIIYPNYISFPLSL